MQTWWESAIKGHACIDTQRVDSSRHIRCSPLSSQRSTHILPLISFHSHHFNFLAQFLRRRNASQSTLSPYFCPSLMTFSHFHRLQFTKRWPTSGPKWRPAEVVCLPAMSNERLPCVRCTSRRCAFQHIKKCLRRKKRALVLDKNIACIDLLSPETSHFISMQRL